MKTLMKMKAIVANSTLSNSHLPNTITGHANPIQLLSLLLLYSLRIFHSFLSLSLNYKLLTTILQPYEQPHSHAHQRGHSKDDQLQ